MILAIDARNESVSFGVRDGSAWAARFSFGAPRGRSPWEWALAISDSLGLCGIEPGRISSSALSCVVPSLSGSLSEACERLFGAEPLVIGPGVRTGVRIATEHPSELGTDIVCGAVAAIEEAKAAGMGDSPIVVAEFASAAVFSALAPAKGGYELKGAAIAPGIFTAMAALRKSTAQLPEVNLSQPEAAIGRNTRDAIRSGLVIGWREMSKGMLERFSSELGGKAFRVASGAPEQLALVSRWEAFDSVRDDLVLSGVAIVANSARKNG
jgi:type III pantothenate kinase